jgi:hypothetical protein
MSLFGGKSLDWKTILGVGAVILIISGQSSSIWSTLNKETGYNFSNSQAVPKSKVVGQDNTSIHSVVPTSSGPNSAPGPTTEDTRFSKKLPPGVNNIS